MRLRHTVSCVAWCPSPANTAVPTIASIECLLGSADGSISTLSLPPNDDIFSKSAALARQFERDHTVVYAFSSNESVIGLSVRFWKDPQGPKEGTTTSRSKTAWVLVTTQERALELNVPIPSGNSGWSAIGKYGWAEQLSKAPTEQRLSTGKYCIQLRSAALANLAQWNIRRPAFRSEPECSDECLLELDLAQ
jgi:hypothetical protein